MQHIFYMHIVDTILCIYIYTYIMYNLFTPCLSDVSQCVKFWVFPEVMIGDTKKQHVGILRNMNTCVYIYIYTYEILRP